MLKRNQSGKQPSCPDPWLKEIKWALNPGRFIRYDDMFRFVDDLERVHEKLTTLVKDAKSERAIRLYEDFLSGCYKKIEECDDSGGYLSMFFDELFCGWVKVRQAAGRPAEETVEQILKWKEDDDYGFCHDIEKDLAAVLNREGYQFLVGHFQNQIEKALPDTAGEPMKAIFDYENEVRLPALSLKDMFQTRRDVRAYAALCERLG